MSSTVVLDGEFGLVQQLDGEFGSGVIFKGLDFETGVFKPTEDDDQPTIYFSRHHDTAPIFFGLADTTGTYDDTLSTAQTWFLWNFREAFNSVIEIGDDETYGTECYGCCSVLYRGSAERYKNRFTSNNYVIASIDAMNNVITPSYFVPPQNAGQMVMRAGRTYKWYAVWKQ